MGWGKRIGIGHDLHRAQHRHGRRETGRVGHPQVGDESTGLVPPGPGKRRVEVHCVPHWLDRVSRRRSAGNADRRGAASANRPGWRNQADAQDLKSWDPQGSCGFDSRPRHHPVSQVQTGRSKADRRTQAKPSHSEVVGQSEIPRLRREGPFVPEWAGRHDRARRHKPVPHATGTRQGHGR
jgi:hypothetical protein